MKVLHTAALLRPPSGILNQMRWEQEAANALGIDWRVKMFCPSGFIKPEEIIQEANSVRFDKNKRKISKIFDWFSLRCEYHQWLKSQENEVDIFVLRYYVHDPFQLQFVKTSKKPVFFVHHTLEGPELAMPEGLGAKGRSFLDNLLAPPTIRAASGTIGVTNEIIKYEKQRAGQPKKTSILYPNGIMFDDGLLADDERTDVPEFLFVASFFAPWHGLDLLLESIQTSDTKFVLHLVGDLSEEDRNMAEADSRIVLHGRKNQQEIRRIAARCWGGISSFALHRKNMKEACTLKVREYLMMGLPVYAGYVEMLSESFPYYEKGTASIEALLDFFSALRLIERSLVKSESKPYLDKKILLSSLFEKLRTYVG